jgi:hypothetical protein
MLQRQVEHKRFPGSGDASIVELDRTGPPPFRQPDTPGTRKIFLASQKIQQLSGLTLQKGLHHPCQ